MASQESVLRLKFLQDSADLLRSRGAATAAHLMSLHNRILHENSKPIKARQHQTWCGACGSPRKVAYTKVLQIKQGTGKTKRRVVSKAASKGAVVYKCLRCSSRTIQDRRPQLPKANGLSSTPQSDSRPSTPLAENSLLGSANVSSHSEVSTKNLLDNASSKKRAKARKQGGLQALLASKQRSQESKVSGASLDLFDFLQQ